MVKRMNCGNMAVYKYAQIALYCATKNTVRIFHLYKDRVVAIWKFCNLT